MVDVLELLTNPSAEGAYSKLAHDIAVELVERNCKAVRRPQIVGETACKALKRAQEIHATTRCQHARAIALVEVSESVAVEYGVPQDTECIIDALQLATDADEIAAQLADVALPGKDAIEMVDEFSLAVEAFRAAG